MKAEVKVMSSVKSIVLAAALAGAAGAPAPAAAQTHPQLVAAVRLAQDARGDSARAQVGRMLAATPPADTLYPQILYTMGMISTTTEEMRGHFQRVVVEHSTSKWADQSLYRLAQIAYASGDYAGAARQLGRIRDDYPTSPLIPHAAYWGAQAQMKAGDLVAACEWVDGGLAKVGQDADMRRQLESAKRERCGAAQLAAARAEKAKEDSADAADRAAEGATPTAVTAASDQTRSADAPARDTAPRPAIGAPRPGSSGWQVQIAAVGTRGAGEELLAKLRKAGFDGLLVQEGGLYKVRVGGFASRAAAAGASQKIKTKLGGSPFVVAPG
jgi:cell division septation protein DedD